MKDPIRFVDNNDEEDLIWFHAEFAGKLPSSVVRIAMKTEVSETGAHQTGFEGESESLNWVELNLDQTRQLFNWLGVVLHRSA